MNGRRGRVLVTGATGFVGQALVRALAARGWAVRAPVRRAVAAPDPAIEVVPGFDLAASAGWGPLTAGVDAVVHAAGLAHATGAGEDAVYRQLNTDATVALARHAEGRVGRIVFLSSIRAQSGPTASDVLTEAVPPAPTDAYGRSKLAAEEALARLDVPVLSMRPVVVYGPGVKGNVALLRAAAERQVPLPLGSLTAPRSFLSLENLVDAVIHALETPEPLTGPAVVADPEPASVAGLVAAMRESWNRPAGLVRVPPSALGAAMGLLGRKEQWERLSGPLVADPSRLIGLGWTPLVGSTKEGIRRWLGSSRSRG